jgi:hypothetical protein
MENILYKQDAREVTNRDGSVHTYAPVLYVKTAPKLFARIDCLDYMDGTRAALFAQAQDLPTSDSYSIAQSDARLRFGQPRAGEDTLAYAELVGGHQIPVGATIPEQDIQTVGWLQNGMKTQVADSRIDDLVPEQELNILRPGLDPF